MSRPRRIPGGASVFEAPDLTACVNDARDLMGYDRKLKNAVSQSVIEWLDREGLTLRWTMGGDDHRLCEATVATSQARHLAKKVQGGAAAGPVVEDLNGRGFVEMTAALFGGAAAQASEPPSAARNAGPNPAQNRERNDNSFRRAGRLTPRSQ